MEGVCSSGKGTAGANPRSSVPAWVTERTDPGWVFLFPTAAALLVERGSPLSHSAIVARELGLPTIVNIPELTRHLHSGDEVELDGQTGEVWIRRRHSDQADERVRRDP